MHQNGYCSYGRQTNRFGLILAHIINTVSSLYRSSLSSSITDRLEQGRYGAVSGLGAPPQSTLIHL